MWAMESFLVVGVCESVGLWFGVVWLSWPSWIVQGGDAKKESNVMRNLIVVFLLAATLLIGVGVQVSNATSARTVEQDATATPAEEEEGAATPAAAEEEAATPEAAEEAAATPEAAEEATPEAKEEEGRGVAVGMTLPMAVRDAVDSLKDVQAAEDAGYGLVHGCISGPNGGAMGVHYANADLVGDGKIDLAQPEAVVYEQSYGRLRPVAVEYIVLAEAWDAANDGPPVLMGQVFNFNSAPNRYRLPAFYELHVWAWKFNPTGVFADWNPLVSCEEYTGMDMGGE